MPTFAEMDDNAMMSPAWWTKEFSVSQAGAEPRSGANYTMINAMSGR